jgi:hypothetical protein
MTDTRNDIETLEMVELPGKQWEVRVLEPQEDGRTTRTVHIVKVDAQNGALMKEQIIRQVTDMLERLLDA